MDFDFIEIAKNAKIASLKVAELDTNIKNQALENIAQMLEEHKSEIFEANAQDLEEAKTLVETGEISQSAYNRLKLDENKMRDMIQGVKDIANLDDPIGKVLLKRQLDEDLK